MPPAVGAIELLETLEPGAATRGCVPRRSATAHAESRLRGSIDWSDKAIQLARAVRSSRDPHRSASARSAPRRCSSTTTPVASICNAHWNSRRQRDRTTSRPTRTATSVRAPAKSSSCGRRRRYLSKRSPSRPARDRLLSKLLRWRGWRCAKCTWGIGRCGRASHTNRAAGDIEPPAGDGARRTRAFTRRRGEPGVERCSTRHLELALASGTLQSLAPVRTARAEAALVRGDLSACRRGSARSAWRSPPVMASVVHGRTRLLDASRGNARGPVPNVR